MLLTQNLCRTNKIRNWNVLQLKRAGYIWRISIVILAHRQHLKGLKFHKINLKFYGMFSSYIQFLLVQHKKIYF